MFTNLFDEASKRWSEEVGALAAELLTKGEARTPGEARIEAERRVQHRRQSQASAGQPTTIETLAKVFPAGGPITGGGAFLDACGTDGGKVAAETQRPNPADGAPNPPGHRPYG